MWHASALMYLFMCMFPQPSIYDTYPSKFDVEPYCRGPQSTKYKYSFKFVYGPEIRF